jgi:MOSC domain-containing protein YiiM
MTIGPEPTPVPPGPQVVRDTAVFVPAPQDEQPRLLAVNVGTPRDVELDGRVISTSIWKEPVTGRLPVRGVNVAGDDQADRTVHGGPDKAVYAYAAEDIAWWTEQLGADLGHAPFGENLTTLGVDVSGARIGEQWAIGSALFEVRQSRMPCFKLGLRIGDPRFVRTFAKTDRPGAYLRILREGDVGAGDPVEIVHRPDHEVTVALMHRALLQDHDLLPELLAAPTLMPEWRAFILERTG